MSNLELLMYGTLAVICAAILIHQDIIRERVVSRRASKKKTKEEYAEVGDGISYLLETMVKAGKVRPGTINRIKRDMRKIGLKDIGYEPSFGKPWYFPEVRPSVNLLKVQIMERLPKGVLKKFLDRRPPKKHTGMFAYLNDVK